MRRSAVSVVTLLAMCVPWEPRVSTRSLSKTASWTRRQAARGGGVVLVFALLAATPVSAQDTDDWSTHYFPVLHLGARLGYIRLNDVDDDGSFNWGLTGGAFVASRFAVEASLDWQETEILAYLLDDPDLGVEIERETTSLQAGLLFMPFPEHRVRPYATGGLGYYYSKYTSEFYPREKVSNGGYFAGLGLEVSGFGWDDRLSFVLDTRWLFTQEDYEDTEIHADGFSVAVGVRAKFF